DLLQLASENVTIVIPHKGYQQAEYLNPQKVEEKYGIRPDQVVPFKGLCGDNSDNLPGVNGIGPKTAAQLIREFGSLEGVYANLEKIRPSVRDKLERDREQAFFCERMALLICDIPLPFDLKDVEIEKFPTADIIEFFRKMEFTLLLKRIQQICGTDYGRQHFAPSHEVSFTLRDEEKQMSLF
ncbi:MAG: polymerase protein, partial [Candidatus Peregrinibacteria bacterium GW2011_GWA2_44_7]